MQIIILLITNASFPAKRYSSSILILIHDSVLEFGLVLLQFLINYRKNADKYSYSKIAQWICLWKNLFENRNVSFWG